jgi:hypothetical protein
MNQSVRHVLHAGSVNRRNQDFATPNARSTIGGFVRPKKVPPRLKPRVHP